MPRLGVLGWPVAHSRSPAMHNAAFAELAMTDWRYQLLPVPPALFAETVRALPAAGFLGANVTIPHKHVALELADDASARASAIGAANTLMFSAEGGITADNTDAPGLLMALGEPVEGKRALVLGAGGSARAVVWALLDAGAAEVLVWNRTEARARSLAAELGARAVQRPEPADLLINCTSVGLSAHSHEDTDRTKPLQPSATHSSTLNQLDLGFDQVGEYSYVVDLVYRAGSTELLDAARAHRARTLDGLEVLVAQGALSFELWTGRKPPLEAMRAAARGHEDRA
jgi:shikimate dehydrogenase